MKKIYVVGMGPGSEEMMTGQAIRALEESEVLVGYPVYLQLLPERFQKKEKRSTPMKQEKERCQICFEEADLGKVVSLVCSGDAGIYGLATLLLELAKDRGAYEIEVVPGITAACSGAARLGAPLSHDFCVISLSDLLTPWETIEKRLLAAAKGDFVIAIYNPSSRKRPDYLKRACEILLTKIEPERACGYVENIGRVGEKAVTCTLQELKEKQVNMFTTVFIGNRTTEIYQNQLITKRGYRI